MATTDIYLPDGSGHQIEIFTRDGKPIATIKALAYSDGSWGNLDITWPDGMTTRLNSWDNGTPLQIEHPALSMVSVDIRQSP